MVDERVEGIVLKKFSGFYYVQDQQTRIYECKLRGKIQELVMSGDRVEISLLDEEHGVLERALPRVSQLYRPRIANLSTVLIVMAYNKPAPSLDLLDRLLVLILHNRLTPYIVLNKSDLPADAKAEQIETYYPRGGFNFISTSTINKTGIASLVDSIAGQIAVFAGPSGTGKSSLLNEMVAGIHSLTQDVSVKIGRGKHTTRHVELFPLESGGLLADSPGFSTLDLPPMKSQELAPLFPDMQKYAGNCQFADCLHNRERECAVKDAAQDGLLPASRYNNYISMLKEVMAAERCYR